MERNLILAIVLSMAVYVGWFAWMEKHAPKPVPPAVTEAGAPRAEAVAGLRPAAPRASAGGPAAAARAVAAAPQGEAAAPRGELVMVEAAGAQAGIDPAGAALASFEFQGPLGKVQLMPAQGEGYFATWSELAFKPVAARWPHAAAFEAQHPDGFLIRKEYRFSDGKELSLLRIELKNPGRRSLQVPAWRMSFGPGLGTVPTEQAENLRNLRTIGLFPPPEGRKQDHVEKLAPGESKPDWKWLAVDNRFFIAAVFPQRPEFTGYQVEMQDKVPTLRLDAAAETLAPGAVSGHDIPFYLGPKAYSRIEALHVGLEKAVDFGWFDFIGRRMLKLLQFLQKRTGNWGWAIILLTVLLQIVLFPLTLKGLKAQAAMRRIQPEVTRLQQKYSKDAPRLNQEMMALYKSKGANPMGGCLPMLLQLPIFVALFNTLRNAWELHGSPWIFWIHDLSAPDPYRALPIIMGGFMYIQNKMMQMPAADPAQAQVMKFMPIIFTFMFLKFPAGLVLYWLTSSMLNTAQQFVLKDRI